MKRPRESKQNTMCRENNCSDPLPDPIVVSSFLRDEPSRRSFPCPKRRNVMPRNVLLGAMILATVVLLSGNISLPLAHAVGTTATRSMASANSATFLDGSEGPFFRHRRIPEDNEHESFDEVVVSQSSSNSQECTEEVSKCIQCTYSEQQTYEACAPTGNWQKFKCSAPEGSEGTEAKYEMKSCKYTDLVNGLAMFQFQVFCLMIGALSIVSVKKQKKLSMSMFDQRKQRMPNNAKGKSSIIGSNKRSEEENIEFTPMTNQQRERVPLMQRAESIEII